MPTSIHKRREKLLAEARNKNLRQLLLRATRALNGLLLDGLKTRGHDDVRLTHCALLANLDLDGDSLSGLAARANMTKQAAGQLAKELQTRGYIVLKKDPRDARSRTVYFTNAGWTLMMDSFKIVEDVEERCSQVLGDQTMDGLRTGLAAFIGAYGVDQAVAPEPSAGLEEA